MSDDLQDYLKDGETVMECIQRHRRDIDALMTLLVKEKLRAEAAEARCQTLEARLKEIAATAMTAQSDPYAKPGAYRGALAAICGLALRALSPPSQEPEAKDA